MRLCSKRDRIGTPGAEFGRRIENRALAAKSVASTPMDAAIAKVVAAQSILDERRGDINGGTHLALCNALKDAYDALMALQNPAFMVKALQNEPLDHDRHAQLTRMMRDDQLTWPALAAMLNDENDAEHAATAMNALFLADVSWRQAAATHPIVVDALVQRVRVAEGGDEVEVERSHDAMTTLALMASECSTAKSAIMDGEIGLRDTLRALLEDNGGGNALVLPVARLIVAIAGESFLHREAFEDASTMRALVNALQHGENNAACRDAVCAALAFLVEHCPNNKKMLVELGALPSIAATLDELEHRPALWGFDNGASLDDSSPYLGAILLIANICEENAPAKAQLVSLGVHAKLIELFEDVPEPIKQSVLHALSELAMDCEHVVALHDAGVLPLVESVLAQHADHVRLTGSACMLVCRLTKQAPAGLLRALCGNGIAENIVTLLKDRFLGTVAKHAHDALLAMCDLRHGPLRQALLGAGADVAFASTLRNPSRLECHKVAQQGLDLLRMAPHAPNEEGASPKRARRA